MSRMTNAQNFKATWGALGMQFKDLYGKLNRFHRIEMILLVALAVEVTIANIVLAILAFGGK